MTGRPQEWLVVRAPRAAEARFELRASPLRIGRGPGNQVVLRDEHVSQVHAEIVERDGERWVRDLGSRNGTCVNQARLVPGALRALHDGDIVLIGASELEYNRPVSHHEAPTIVARPEPVPPAGSATAPVARVRSRHAARPPPLPEPPYTPREARRFLRPLILSLLAAAVILSFGAWALAPSRVSILVLGSDARPDELRRGDRGRTDTLLTVVADRSPARVVLVSVPRDLWVQIPGFGQERINAAYTLGGPSAAKRVVADLLGVPVDRYALVGLQGVRDIVDAAGGVDIDVDVPIHDDAYPTDDYGTVVIDIAAGRQHMDGETALRYARTRHQDNDFGRTARQQQVLAALRSKLLQPAHWVRLPAVIVAARRATMTDLGIPELVALGATLIGTRSEPERVALDLGLVEEFTGGDGAYLLRPKPGLQQAMASRLSAPRR